MKREEILKKAEECVCGKRQEDYGTPEDNFKTIADLWTAYIASKCVHYDHEGCPIPKIYAVDVGLMMCLFKIARLMGDNPTVDSFVDLAGYAACAGDIEEDKKGMLHTTGAYRTGCMFCMFGCHLEKYPNRFQKMKETHPTIYRYCMKPVSDGGLGLDEVLTFIGVEH